MLEGRSNGVIITRDHIIRERHVGRSITNQPTGNQRMREKALIGLCGRREWTKISGKRTKNRSQSVRGTNPNPIQAAKPRYKLSQVF